MSELGSLELDRSTWLDQAEPRTPPEWAALRDRVASLPEPVRTDLAPMIDAAIEHARFRQRVTELAAEAVEQARHERLLLEFDLEATRREHRDLARRLGLDVH